MTANVVKLFSIDKEKHITVDECIYILDIDKDATDIVISDNQKYLKKIEDEYYLDDIAFVNCFIRYTSPISTLFCRIYFLIRNEEMPDFSLVELASHFIKENQDISDIKSNLKNIISCKEHLTNKYT